MRQLLHYRLLEKIGEGGMGQVFLALDTRLDRRVALKVLPRDVAGDAARLERFRREARVLAALNHPGIVTLHSIEEFEGSPVLAMEYLEGETLDRKIGTHGMPLAEFLPIAVQLADAVRAAHERGIVHRDLKPTNVMIVGAGRVKVLDFGLATAVAQDSETDRTATELTAQGTILGTTAYMSPEQLRSEPLDHRTDIFSLGVVLYQMSTGERPFRGATAVEVMTAILRDEPTGLSGEIGRIVRRCLEKKPDARYGSVSDLLKDLKGELPTETPRSAPTPKADDGFWVAVMPFRGRGTDPALESLAEDFTEEIVTGLSRFSYLRVVGPGVAGTERNAPYVLEGSVRRAGTAVRIAGRLVETGSGSHLWAETYDRPFDPDRTLELIDDVVPCIVSTSADMHGVLPRAMSETLRLRDPDDLSPYEAVLRSFGYVERLTAEEHLEVRTLMERTAARAPTNADALAMLSFVYAEEFKHGFNLEPGALDRALDAARKAVAAGPSNHLAYHVLAQALFFRRELPAFRNAAERAVELNPMDGGTIAFMGILIGYAGDWERGPALAARAMRLNPNHPGWYHFGAFFDAYRKRDYAGALDVATRINLPSYFHYHGALAMAAGQLGNAAVANRAVEELLSLKPDFAETAAAEWSKWLGRGELLDHVLDGLRRAGLSIGHNPGS